MITETNPFIYSHPVGPDDIIDRDDETQNLVKNAVGGHFVRLYAPRKYGKTILIQRAMREGETLEGLIPIAVGLYLIVLLADVAVRFERAYSRALKGAIRTQVADCLQRTGLE